MKRAAQVVEFLQKDSQISFYGGEVKLTNPLLTLRTHYTTSSALEVFKNVFKYTIALLAYIAKLRGPDPLITLCTDEVRSALKCGPPAV